MMADGPTPFRTHVPLGEPRQRQQHAPMYRPQAEPVFKAGVHDLVKRVCDEGVAMRENLLKSAIIHGQDLVISDPVFTVLDKTPYTGEMVTRYNMIAPDEPWIPPEDGLKWRRYPTGSITQQQRDDLTQRGLL